MAEIEPEKEIPPAMILMELRRFNRLVNAVVAQQAIINGKLDGLIRLVSPDTDHPVSEGKS